MLLGGTRDTGVAAKPADLPEGLSIHHSIHQTLSQSHGKKHGENTSGMMQKNETRKIGQSTPGKFVQATFDKYQKEIGDICLNSWHILMTNLMFDCDKSESEIMTNPNQRLELGEPGSVRLGGL